jgi:hypothetical protein
MPDLKVSDLRPFIPAKDFVVSKEFYAGLGWKVKDVDDGLALVQLADQHFYIQNYYLKEVAENCMLHLTVEDARAWYQHVSSVLQNRDSPRRVYSRQSSNPTGPSSHSYMIRPAFCFTSVSGNSRVTRSGWCL